jgi:CheY-like chemotaxis protein
MEQSPPLDKEPIRQLQEMEILARLTAPVLHNFNNVLTTIIGYTDLALEHFSEKDPFWIHLDQIKMAGMRATGIASQLSAFCRTQVRQQRIVDLNEIITHIKTMLQQLMGGGIEVRISQSQDLNHIKADPVELQHLIMNLAINARDAMLHGGELTLTTENITVDQKYVHGSTCVHPGSYVVLTISDTGCGMDEVLLERIFEPFFTTKGKEKGTGLGLSTVYDTVAQYKGYVLVDSEVGRGTTFKIYLPVADEMPEGLNHPGNDLRDFQLRGRYETVLLVEDDPSLRDLMSEILSEEGYGVLEAANGQEAEFFVQNCIEGEFHLLLTDVEMPRMGGRELAQKVRILHPEVKMLFISGYHDVSDTRNAALQPGTVFLQKPFSKGLLVRKVREVLDSPAPNGGPSNMKN